MIVDYLSDIAREFSDRARLRSSVTRTVNLWLRSGLDIESFAGKMLEARRITKEHWGSIKGELQPGRPKSAMHYWFAVLEDVLGLRGKSLADHPVHR